MNKDGRVTAREIYEWTADRVEKLTRLLEGPQRPSWYGDEKSLISIKAKRARVEAAEEKKAEEKAEEKKSTEKTP